MIDSKVNRRRFGRYRIQVGCEGLSREVAGQIGGGHGEGHRHTVAFGQVGRRNDGGPGAVAIGIDRDSFARAGGNGHRAVGFSRTRQRDAFRALLRVDEAVSGNGLVGLVHCECGRDGVDQITRVIGHRFVRQHCVIASRVTETAACECQAIGIDADPVAVVLAGLNRVAKGKRGAARAREINGEHAATANIERKRGRANHRH